MKISIPMCSRDALLKDPLLCPDGHRGIWYYDPKVFGSVRIGEVVDFFCCGALLASGEVTEILQPHAKFCSRLNDKAFRWRPL
jgi:hypothetical protein